MFIIKIWGSVFAPKQSELFNTSLLKKLSKIILKNCNEKVILIHWTWNIGHDFVNKYWVTRDTFELYKNIRKWFFKNMEDIFIWYKREAAENILIKWNELLYWNENILISWDINSNNLDIISSDEVFWFLSEKNANSKKIILTDVEWVLDWDGNTIKKLKISWMNKINYWDKVWDVTDWMRWKLSSLENCLTLEWEWVWIIDGNDLDNFENILSKWEGKWSYIIK